MSELVIKEQEFKGNPIFSIFRNETDEIPLVSFGLNKAKAIVECIGDIENFIERNDKKSRN